MFDLVALAHIQTEVQNNTALILSTAHTGVSNRHPDLPSFWTAGGFLCVFSHPPNCPGGAHCCKIPTLLQKYSAI